MGMQLPDKYKENFDVSSECMPFVRKLVAFSLYFSGRWIPSQSKLFLLLILPTLAKAVQDWISDIQFAG